MTFRIGLVCLVTAFTAPVFAQQAGAPPPSQTAPPPISTSAISGVVVDGTTGSPVPGAIVTLRTPQAYSAWPQPNQLTDDKGRFAFVNLPASPDYTVMASKFGYLSGGYGRETDPNDPLRPIALKDNDWASNLRVTIWKPGSISGTVRDENGAPVIGVFVRALVRYRLAGRDELAAGPITLTDDRGAYRIAGLGPGRYIIQVPSVQASLSAGAPAPGGSGFDGVLEMDDTSRLVIGRYPLPPPPSNGRPMAYPIAFHPTSSLLTQAAVIDLTYGDDRANIDVTLMPAPSVRVSGVVEGPPEALATLTLRLLPVGLDNLGHGSETATTMVGPTGQFTFINVPAGSYVIDAPVKVSEFLAPGRVGSRTSFPGPPGVGGWGIESAAPDSITGLQFTTMSFRGSAANYSARMPLTVGAGDMIGVVIRLQRHLTMMPRFVFENEPAQGRPAPPPTQVLPLSLDPAGGEAHLGRPRSTSQQGTPSIITIPGVMPGKYWLRQMGDSRWIIKSVSWDGRDYTTQPIDTTGADDLSDVVITVTNAVPELTGNVRVSGDAKPDESVVVVFPVDPTLWRNTGMWPARLKSASPSDAGAYRFATLPAGSYFVAAIDRSRRMTWIDPEVLAQLARTAVPITLTWGGKVNQDVTFTAVKK